MKRSRFGIRTRLRKHLSRLTGRDGFVDQPRKPEVSEVCIAKLDDERETEQVVATISDWSKQTDFRSSLTLRGSVIVKIWFESVEEEGVRFSLDLAAGRMFARENWTPDIQMPGDDANDAEPLSVWGIESADGCLSVIMHVDAFDALYVDGELACQEDYPEVMALLHELTNVAVRDMWIAPEF